MANLDFLNQFAVGGKQQSNPRASSSKSSSEKKSSNDSSAVKDFISNFRKMVSVAKDMQASGQQPTSSEPASDANPTRVVAPATLENTKFTGQERGGIADPTAAYYEQTGSTGGKNPFKESMDALKRKVAEYQKVEPLKMPEENPDDFVEYTYKPGDTFGQVILDLGINTKKGLWGKGGDVEFYTKQLREQGIPGMVPIGRKIRLKKRK